MTDVEQLLDDFPEAARSPLKQAWSGLSDERRGELAGLLNHLPVALKPLKEVMGLVLEQYRPLISTKRRIAIVGPANVGKSTLYNQFVARKEDRAAVSYVPGTTRTVQEADTGLFRVVDTPGADAVGEVGTRERDLALQAAGGADFLLIVFEATHGIRRYERDLFDGLLALGKPFVILLNKIDLVPKAEREQVLASAAQNLDVERSQIIETVAPSGVNVGRALLAIVKSEPGLLAALGEALPEYRSRLAWSRIVPAAGAASGVALLPLPLADVLPLLGIQAGLVLSISRIYGYRITAARARELIATFGIGLMARRAFQELSKLGGVPGWLLSAAIAAATTVAIGYGAATWFDRGERPTQDALNKVVSDISAYLRGQLSDLARHRPGRGSLRERIVAALHSLPASLKPPVTRSEAVTSEDPSGRDAGLPEPE